VRRRILGAAVLAVVVAVVVFGVPLAIAVGRLFYDEERSELERVALRSVVTVPPEFARTHDVGELPPTDPSVHVALYGVGGHRVTGDGPSRADRAVRGALRGRVTDGGSGGILVVAVPVTASERVVGVVRAASSRGEVRGRVWGTWAAMAGLALVAGAGASLFAALQARRLARPLQRLEAVAEDLGAGDFTSRAEPSGVGEIDRTGQALNRTAQRLDDMVARERAFTARASHQLRTPLTRLRLGLDAALHDRGDLRAAAEEAIVSADQLSRTIDDVLAVSRGTPDGGEPLDVAALLTDLKGRWHGTLAEAGRPLTVSDEAHPTTAAAEPAVRQILEVLLDNAYRHGRGRVSVTARDGGGAVAIDVVDEGTVPGGGSLVPVLAEGVPERSEARRLGLRMAQSLTDGVGGRLVHAHTEARTRMTLLLPPRPD
jgi:signal transduction histidine kinase